MKLSEIISALEDGYAVEYGTLRPYLKSLAIYTARYATNWAGVAQVVLIPVSVTNGAQYCIVEVDSEAREALKDYYLEDCYNGLTADELEDAMENAMFYARPILGVLK